MALAVTLLGTATFTTASGTKTVVATPAVGDLIVIVTSHSGNTSAATPTDDNSSGAYVRINSAVAQSSVDTLGIHIRTTLIGAASSTTFTHAPGTTTGGGLAVFKVTGMTKTGSAAALQSAIQSNQASGGTPTPVFGAAVKTGNAVIGAVMNASNTAALTPRSSPAYTERCDVGYNTPATGLETMSINSGETATSIAWGGTSPSAFCSLVLELDANPAPIALTGQALSVVCGSLLAAFGLALAGQGLSGSQNSVGPVPSFDLVGQNVSVAQGSASAPVTLLGQSVAGAQGSVSPDRSIALTGLAVTANAGSVASSRALDISGPGLTASQGNTLASNAGVLLGQVLSTARGTVVQSSGAALLGQGLNAARGSTAGSASFLLSGLPVSIAGNSVLDSSSVGLLGFALPVGQGNLTAQVGNNVTVGATGQETSASLGTLVATGSDVNAALTGLSITASRGSLVPAISPILQGNGLTASKGLVSLNSVAVLQGGGVTASKGLTPASSGFPLPGQDLFSSLGGFSTDASVNFTGQVIQSGQGLVAVHQSEVTAGLTGLDLLVSLNPVIIATNTPTPPDREIPAGLQTNRTLPAGSPVSRSAVVPLTSEVSRGLVEGSFSLLADRGKVTE